VLRGRGAVPSPPPIGSLSFLVGKIASEQVRGTGRKGCIDIEFEKGSKNERFGKKRDAQSLSRGGCSKSAGGGWVRLSFPFSSPKRIADKETGVSLPPFAPMYREGPTGLSEAGQLFDKMPQKTRKGTELSPLV